MSDRDLAADLRGFPHFQDLPDDTLDAIAAGSRRVSFDRGDVVIREGAPARAFYGVLAGAVRLYRLSPDGREQVLHVVGPGRTFAEAAVLTMRAYPAHGTAAAPRTELVEIDARAFLARFRSEPSLAATMIGSLSVWLARLTDRVEELSEPSASARLARYLLRLPSRADGGRTVLELPLPKRELAARLAIAPETLSRLLRRWRDDALLVTVGRRVEVLDERRLVELAEGAPRRRGGRPATH